nr:YfhO family protein [Candidatus Levybacteria bacterium]
DVIIYPGFNEENNKRINVLNVLGVKYIIDRKENISTQNVFNSKSYKKIYQDNGWRIYENNAALPRFFLTSNYKVYSSPKEFSKIFFSQNFTDYKTILLDKDPKLNLDPLDGSEKINLVSYQPNSINFVSDTKGKHLLFLSDTYYPGWVAEIDGKETQIYKADYAFRAIAVPGGIHKISFTFKSSSFRIGYIISLISIFIVFILFVIKPYDKKDI